MWLGRSELNLQGKIKRTFSTNHFVKGHLFDKNNLWVENFDPEVSVATRTMQPPKAAATDNREQ